MQNRELLSVENSWVSREDKLKDKQKKREREKKSG